MYKYTPILCFIIIYSVFVECAVSARSSSYSSATNVGTKNTGTAGRTYFSDEQQENTNGKIQKIISPGISAWGIITIILLIIFIGAGAYWGIICYPLICKKDRNYTSMDATSSTNTTPTPTISGEFERNGNYSSRSTTPHE